MASSKKAAVTLLLLGGHTVDLPADAKIPPINQFDKNHTFVDVDGNEIHIRENTVVAIKRHQPADSDTP